MSEQETVRNWKAGAYAAIAKYELEGERASFEDRLASAREACERAGVSFRFGSPEVTGDVAVKCPCGAIVPDNYVTRDQRVAGVLHCDACRAKAAEAARQDAVAEGRPPLPELPAKTEDIPF